MCTRAPPPRPRRRRGAESRGRDRGDPAATQRLCSSQQSPQVHPLMPATRSPASRTKIASSTSSPSPMAADASRRICVSRNSMSSGSGSSSTWNSTATGFVRRRRAARSARRRRSTSGTTGSSRRGSRPPWRRPTGHAVPSLPHRILAEDERPRVIGFDDPFGERLVAHFVESPEHDDDVGERRVAERRRARRGPSAPTRSDTATTRRRRR